MAAISLSTIFMALTVANTAMKARSAMQQGQYEGGMYDLNAGLADQQAADALTRGGEAANRYRGDVKQVVGAQRTSMAAQGVDISEGTAAQIVSDSETLGELDALTIQNNAKREAWGFAVQAADLRARGKAARQQGKMGAYQSLLSGGVQLAGFGYSGGFGDFMKGKRGSMG